MSESSVKTLSEMLGQPYMSSFVKKIAVRGYDRKQTVRAVALLVLDTLTSTDPEVVEGFEVCDVGLSRLVCEGPEVSVSQLFDVEVALKDVLEEVFDAGE